MTKAITSPTSMRLEVQKDIYEAKLKWKNERIAELVQLLEDQNAVITKLTTKILTDNSSTLCEKIDAIERRLQALESTKITSD